MPCRPPTDHDHDILVQQFSVATMAVAKAFPDLLEGNERFYVLVAAAVQALAIAAQGEVAE